MRKITVTLLESLSQKLEVKPTTQPSTSQPAAKSEHSPSSPSPPDGIKTRPYTRVVVKTHKTMVVALLREIAPKGKAFDWRKAWKQAKKEKLFHRTPHVFYVRKHGMYTMVVFDPTAKREKGKKASDGLVMHKLDVSPTGCCGEVVFSLKADRFVLWNGL